MNRKTSGTQKPVEVAAAFDGPHSQWFILGRVLGKLLCLLALEIKVSLHCFYLRLKRIVRGLQINFILFQVAYLRVQRGDLFLQQSQVIAQHPGRCVFVHPFFKVGQWIHFWRAVIVEFKNAIANLKSGGAR